MPLKLFDMRYEVIGSKVFLAALWSCPSPVFPHSAPIGFFCNGDMYSLPLYAGNM